MKYTASAIHLMSISIDHEGVKKPVHSSNQKAHLAVSLTKTASMRPILIILFVSLSCAVGAQKQYLPLYTPNGNHQLRGWYFAPGITYMMPTRFDFTNKIGETEEFATMATYDPGGRVSLYMGVGRFKMLNKMIFPHRIEYGLAYKRLSGFENVLVRQVAAVDNAVLGEQNGQSSFRDNYLSANFTMGQYFQIGEYTYMLGSAGVNADWMFIGNRTIASGVPGVGTELPPSLLFQGFLRFGFGYKLESGWFVEPSLESPIMNFFPFENGRSTLGYFSTRYRPFILTVRLYRQDLRKAADCVGTNSKPENAQLWGKMKKTKKKMKKR